MGYKHQIEDIIDAGTELVRRKGYHQVGVNDILKTCNIPKGSFYNFFYSKEDFALQVLEAYGNKIQEQLTACMSRLDQSPLEQLKSFYSEWIDRLEAEGMNTGCLVHNLAMEMGGNNDKIALKAGQILDNWLKMITGCVREGQQRGEIVDLPPEMLARQIHMGFYGALTLMKLARNRRALDDWYRFTFDVLYCKI